MKTLHRIGAAGLFAGCLSFGIWYVASPATKQAPMTQAQTSPLDTIMEGVEIKQFDKSGDLTHVLTVSKWQHRKDAETADWKTPHLKLIQKKWRLAFNR